MEHATQVFIADSGEDFCTGLTAALQRAGGFQVVGTANDGEQAIRQILERKPEVLVLDLMLSKQDGISVLKSIGVPLPQFFLGAAIGNAGRQRAISADRILGVPSAAGI